ncbi:MAG TPA: hypothetical protein VFF06_22690 [Polyangia bacterium]|nr:hypothetical protein [Polyangia bacterium]
MKSVACIAVVACVGCGGPSAVDTCKKSCAKSVACSGGTTTDLANCQSACDSSSSQFGSCTNASDVLSCQNGCLDLQSCTDASKCASGCPKCIVDTGGADMAGSTSSDLAGGSSSDLSGSMQMQFCSAYCAKASGCNGTNEMSCENACNSQMTNIPPCLATCFNNCLSKSCSELNPCIQACGMMPACN